MIRRLLVLVLLALAALWWWKRRIGTSGTGRAAARPGREPERELGPMVRDRVCNTFLPRSRALSVHTGGVEHYFCSDACRAKFLETSEIRSA